MTADRDLEPSESESLKNEEGEYVVAEKEETTTSSHPSKPAKASDHEDTEDAMPFYTTPKQRQRWGDNQIPPHTEWGDIFFDLFYVAA